MIVAARVNDMAERDDEEEFKKNQREERKTEWREKPLYGQHLRQMESISSEGSWLWLKIGKMKKGTEGLLIAAKDQALRTNVIKSRIDKIHGDSKCRMSKEADEKLSI